MRCQEIKSLLSSNLPSLFVCEENNDFLSLKTPFSYPDGDDIDLFIFKQDSDIVITDMGETLRYLSTYDLDIKSSKNRSEIFEDVLRSFGVNNFKGNLCLSVSRPSDVAEALLRTAQAITRICDLLYTIRPRSLGSFREEVRELLEFNHLEYEEDYTARGGSGMIYDIDFGVKSDKGIQLVKLVTTTSPLGTRSAVDRIVRLWTDVAQVTVDEKMRISLFDDTNVIWRPEDYSVVKYTSTIYTWSKKDQFVEGLKVA